MSRTLCLFGMLCTLALAAGCGDSSKGTVYGEVSLDGKPLEDGLIRFIPADGNTQTADATISKGRYSAVVPPGDKRVEISASKVVGKHKMYDTPDSPTVDDVVELLPPRYNVQSELKLTVKAGSQEKSFELKAK